MRPFPWFGAVGLSGAACAIALARGASTAASAPLPALPKAPSQGAEPVTEPRPVWAGPFREPLQIPTSDLPKRAVVPAPEPQRAVAPTSVPPQADMEATLVLRGTEYANTYYDFPLERPFAGDTPVFDASCRRIALVSREFHDRLCVQGSGRILSGTTVSFARRGCACAEICPRTGQHICYEALDPRSFPNGRGATGRPITPLSTVAVDPAFVPLGTRLFIPEFVGLPRRDGTPHDGCFLAEDRGLRIRGKRIDVFTGDEETRRTWEARVPSYRGVHVYKGGARCGIRP